MLEKFFLILIFLAKTINGIFENCDHYQELNENKTYDIYSPNYPKKYSRGVTCRWVAESPPNTKIILECNDFNIPVSRNCWTEKFGVSEEGRIDLKDAAFYCGKGQLNAVSKFNKLNLVLLTNFWSKRGKFFCSLRVKPNFDSISNCTCGHKNMVRIVGGLETGVNEYPMMAGLVDGPKYVLFCGGTIISSLYTLTAAHCLSRKRPSDVAILVGDHDVSVGNDTDSARLYRSSSFFIHPRYNEMNQKNDIALVKVQNKILFNMKVGPVCLPFKNTRDTFAGETVYAVGWGTTSFGGPSSNKLLHVPLQVLTLKQCKPTYGDLVSEKQICTYEDEKDACQSDSGGPLLWSDPDSGILKVLGIVSYGIQCATHHPSVNTRVTPYLDWIKSTTNEKFCVL